MGAYLIRRLLLVIPTLWAIITINFFIVQIAPGGPLENRVIGVETLHKLGEFPLTQGQGSSCHNHILITIKIING